MATFLVLTPIGVSPVAPSPTDDRERNKASDCSRAQGLWERLFPIVFCNRADSSAARSEIRRLLPADHGFFMRCDQSLFRHRPEPASRALDWSVFTWELSFEIAPSLGPISQIRPGISSVVFADDAFFVLSLPASRRQRRCQVNVVAEGLLQGQVEAQLLQFRCGPIP